MSGLYYSSGTVVIDLNHPSLIKWLREEKTEVLFP
jgi:hypothetical protein